jgi:Icc-related predicted phosphoesterase
LDKTKTGVAAGCEELLKIIDGLNIKLHLSGHIHEGYGERIVNGIRYINASVLDIRYRQVNDPITLPFTLDE